MEQDRLSRNRITADATETEASVSWSFIAARYRERKGETSTSNPALDRTNARIRCWRMLYEFDPEEAERVA